MPPPLILASTSLYRRALLDRLGLAFDCRAPDVDETRWKSAGLAPEELALQLADAKACAVAATAPGAVVIGGDQVAEIDGEVLGKPGNRDANRAQLRKLAGRTHTLLTAVAVVQDGRVERFLDRTRLTMRPLTDDQIAGYVDRDQPFDCAGGYKIEAGGITLFEKIECADATAIEGLPLLQLGVVLRNFGLDFP